ncbi:GntR family transcriptional regulator [Jiangella asiatica]|nr:GntR family transcriptional regulator [Jiangella asiatica]
MAPRTDATLPEFDRLTTGRTDLTSVVYEHLKARIMDLTLEPETPLRIDVIARQVGVSPTPVREALLRLAADELVTKRGARGYFTNPVITRAEFEDLWEFRLAVEPWAAALAARRATAADIAGLREEVAHPAGLGRTMDLSTYRAMQEHDQRFHELVFRVAGNATAADAFRRTRTHLRTFRIRMAAELGDPALREHDTVARAIADGDPEAGAEAMRRHLTSSRDRLLPFVSDA